LWPQRESRGEHETETSGKKGFSQVHGISNFVLLAF
jgi:hypothetical protein